MKDGNISSWYGLSTRTQLEASGIGETKLGVNHVALAVCQAMWTQFNPNLMSVGLLILGMDWYC